MDYQGYEERALYDPYRWISFSLAPTGCGMRMDPFRVAFALLANKEVRIRNKINEYKVILLLKGNDVHNLQKLRVK